MAVFVHSRLVEVVGASESETWCVRVLNAEEERKGLVIGL